MSKETLMQAVALAGGQVHLARGIQALLPGSKISQVHVWGWLNSVKIEVPPPEAVLPIAEHLGWRLTPHLLRPDLYPNPTDALPHEFAVLVAQGRWPVPSPSSGDSPVGAGDTPFGSMAEKVAA